MNPVGAVSAADKTAQGTAPSPKLVKAAQDFESMLLSSWLEKLEASFTGPNDGSDPAHDTLASMGTQAIASALAARGGIGLAKVLLQHFTKASGAVGSAGLGAEKKNSGSQVPLNLADKLL